MKQMARPDTLVVLPTGEWVRESDVKRVRLSRRINFVVELVVFGSLLLVLLFAATSVTP